MSNKGKNAPLRCEIIDGELSVRVGVETFAFATKLGLTSEGKWPKDIGAITCAEGFAKEAIDAMEEEREDGSTHLTDLFDWAALYAIEHGSQYVNLLHKGKVVERGDSTCLGTGEKP